MSAHIKRWSSVASKMMPLILCLFLASCGNGQPATTTPATTSTLSQAFFSTYTNPQLGIKIDYPYGWTKVESLESQTPGPLGGRKGVVLFRAPAEGTNVNINVTELPGNVTLKEFSDALFDRLSQLIVTDYKLIQSTEATLANRPAMKAIFTGRQGKLDLQSMIAWTVDGGVAYEITYLSQTDRFGDLLGFVDHMLESFEIISSGGPGGSPLP